jgi:hypothetical protein
MKPMIEWEEEDLLELIAIGAEEDIHRDWKDAAALDDTDGKKKEIAKDVSSFANSDGGGVVYGLSQGKTKPYKAEAITPVDPNKFSPEWLESVIRSRIQPPLQGLRIKAVNLKTQSPGNVAYVVYVSSSTTAHQADFRYYKRYEYQSVPMADYEVRLAMHRAVWPTYTAILRTGRSPSGGGSIFYAKVTNSSDIVARNVSFNILIPAQLCSNARSYMSETIIFEPDYKLDYARIPQPPNTPDILYPGNPLDIRFESSLLELPKSEVAQRCKVILRVYDQFGRAHETVSTVSLTDPLFVIGDLVVQRGREELF